jgi:hypothetical protein
MSVAKLWETQFSPEAQVVSQIEKRASEMLGKPIDQMSDDEVEAKLAEIKYQEAFHKEAQVDYVRGQVMAEGFMDRLKDAGIDLPGMNEKLGSLASHLGTNGTTK